jgi:hypothetical protein
MADPLRVITQTESWRQEVQADVVSCLRDLLAMAEAGEIQGFAYSAVCADMCVSTGFTKDVNRSAIIGGLERVKHRMLAGE